MTIRDGKGHALLLGYGEWSEDDIYLDMGDDLAECLGCDVEDLVILHALTNGGEKGVGLRVLQKALQHAHSRGRVLVLFIRAESGRDVDQDKLRDWYLRTGLLGHVPTNRGTELVNWLVDKRALIRTKGMHSFKHFAQQGPE